MALYGIYCENKKVKVGFKDLSRLKALKLILKLSIYSHYFAVIQILGAV
jgi:hypothetical protein